LEPVKTNENENITSEAFYDCINQEETDNLPLFIHFRLTAGDGGLNYFNMLRETVHFSKKKCGII
jgi:hypothetical protein